MMCSSGLLVESNPSQAKILPKARVVMEPFTHKEEMRIFAKKVAYVVVRNSKGMKGRANDLIQLLMHVQRKARKG